VSKSENESVSTGDILNLLKKNQRIHDLEQLLNDVDRELDRLGAPKKQESGYGYSLIGRLRKLNVEVIGRLAHERFLKQENEVNRLRYEIKQLQDRNKNR
jgi:hypothetical protein